jgi:hypothetical protein
MAAVRVKVVARKRGLTKASMPKGLSLEIIKRKSEIAKNLSGLIVVEVRHLEMRFYQGTSRFKEMRSNGGFPPWRIATFKVDRQSLFFKNLSRIESPPLLSRYPTRVVPRFYIR